MLYAYVYGYGSLAKILYPHLMFQQHTSESKREIAAVVQSWLYQSVCQCLTSMYHNVPPEMTNIMNMLVFGLRVSPWSGMFHNTHPTSSWNVLYIPSSLQLEVAFWEICKFFKLWFTAPVTLSISYLNKKELFVYLNLLKGSIWSLFVYLFTFG